MIYETGDILNKESQHDPFLDDPINCRALSYMLEGIFDGDENPGLQKLAQKLSIEPFMAALPDSRRSVVALQAAHRARKAIDDVTFMEMML